MKILILTRSLNYGGAERQLVELAKGLHERGHSIVFSTFYSGGPLQKDLEKIGVSVHPLYKRGRWDMFGFLWRLVKLTRKERPDVLHSYLCVPNILAIILAPLLPSARIVLGVGSAFMDLSRYDWIARLTYRLECLLSRFAHLIISNSQSGLRYATANGFPKGKIIVIYNGIDIERFYPDRESGYKIRAEWGVNENERLIGMVGRLDPMKDHPVFLKAVAMLARQHKKLRFVCVGDGPESYKKELHNLSIGLGIEQHIIWPGARSDMPQVYNALDMVVLSSYGEGLPNVIGEAMACDVPCVVTDVGDTALLVRGIGEVVPPRNPEELKCAIERVLIKIETGGYVNGGNRLRIASQYSVKHLVGETEAAFSSLSNQ